MKRFGLLHWISFILIIIALLWLTISYYSLRVIPLPSFAVLICGVIVFFIAEYIRRNKK